MKSNSDLVQSHHKWLRSVGRPEQKASTTQSDPWDGPKWWEHSSNGGTAETKHDKVHSFSITIFCFVFGNDTFALCLWLQQWHSFDVPFQTEINQRTNQMYTCQSRTVLLRFKLFSQFMLFKKIDTLWTKGGGGKRSRRIENKKINTKINAVDLSAGVWQTNFNCIPLL